MALVRSCIGVMWFIFEIVVFIEWGRDRARDDSGAVGSQESGGMYVCAARLFIHFI